MLLLPLLPSERVIQYYQYTLGGEVARKMRLDSTQQVESEKCDLTRLDLKSFKSNEVARFSIIL